MRTLIAALFLCTSLLTPGRDAHGATAGAAVYGVDYPEPPSGLTGCPPWTWLEPTCYTNSTHTPSHLSPQQGLARDIAFMQSQHLGTFQRVWVSLDQLMATDATGVYSGFTTLATLDDALTRFAAAGISVDLVLLTNSNVNGFHPEAIDGQHPAMRAGYLRAVRDVLVHIGADAQDSRTVSVVDLLNEAYYQLERYYQVPANVGAFTGCRTTDGLGVVSSCIDSQIIRPWLQDLYDTAKAADPAIQYTESDTGRLLGVGQQAALSLYADVADVYDIHLYSDDPGSQGARWATGLALPKPWFAGEVGCASGHTACTYDGTAATAADSWWLANLPADGATAVLVEDRRTAWTFPYINGQGEIPTLTAVGRLIAAANSAPTDTDTPIPSDTATSTDTPVPPTATPTNTATSTATHTPVPPTATATPSPPLLPWLPVISKPRGLPHGRFTATLVLVDSLGHPVAVAVTTLTN